MNTKNNPPCTITSKILNLVAAICEKLAMLHIHQTRQLTPYLRKENRIKTIHASLAIENNTLSIEQVTAIINGSRVLGHPKEIREVKNAYEAYEQIMAFDGGYIEHLLKAHALMMNGLVQDSGCFRAGNVGVFNDKDMVHLAPPAELVPQQIEQLFQWYAKSDLHPLVKSSIFHYEFEFIHPFSDGNGRLGRMWQSKLLGEWNEVFYFLPAEELIAKTQQAYYQALAQSDKLGDSAVFVEYMLTMLLDSLSELQGGGLNGVLNGGLNKEEKAIIDLLATNPYLTHNALSEELHIPLRTIQRIMRKLIEKGYIQRVGAKKNGYYEILR